METRFLQTFIVVAETSSLAETARKLNITPSAVIQRIRVLEGEIGRKLIHRSGHSMRPTAAGAAILPEAVRMVRAARDISAIAGGSIEAGGLTVGASNSAIIGLLPDILVALKRNRPKIDVHIVRGQSADLYPKVIADQIDIAIMVKPHFKIPKTLNWALLREEPLVVVVPARMRARDPLAILATEPFIRQDRNNWGGRIADRYLRKMKIRPHEQYELDSLDAIGMMVDRGIGVALVPEWPAPRLEGLAIRKISLPNAPSRQFGLLWPRTSPREWLIRAFVNEAINAVVSQKSRTPDDGDSRRRRPRE
ncbi:LysR family transcriptional regulator [Rhodoplanes serenus]|jgi:DNA-binding transcriptional LysR family regulator|uniref:LysR family transcriptional regulator n=1 Tax=Rhodoplanes serenus TaxID=200615 RepID=UPI000DAC632A|nr:LysR family transcriptional regulator [Rhodoplanes serenus]RAI35699.1 hypothetical protein CH340_05245 [Rhodoplanes serenus]